MVRISVTRELLEDMGELARSSHPNEITIHIGGYIESGTDKIIADSLIYQGYMDDEGPASVITGHMPVVDSIIGTFHTHPGKENGLTEKDKRSFGGYGSIHIIAFHPYKKSDIRIYDSLGNPLDWEIKGDEK